MKRILLLSLIITLGSCNKNIKSDDISEKKTDSSENVVLNSNSDKNPDIDLLKEYISKENKTITDKDGFNLIYKIDRKPGKITKLATSDTVRYEYEGQLANSSFLTLNIMEAIHSLSLNGVHKKDVILTCQVYTINESNPLGRVPVPTTGYESETYYYLPKLQDEAVRKDIIEKITSHRVYHGIEISAETKKADTEWTNISTNLIKSSNILNYK